MYLYDLDIIILKNQHQNVNTYKNNAIVNLLQFFHPQIDTNVDISKKPTSGICCYNFEGACGILKETRENMMKTFYSIYMPLNYYFCG